MLERHFSISERGSTVRIEVLGGVVTFLTMAYIVFVNPAILSQAKMTFAAVAVATALAAAIFTLAAMRGVRAGCLLTVSDTIAEEIVRISDDDLRSAVDNMMALALDTLHALN